MNLHFFPEGPLTVTCFWEVNYFLDSIDLIKIPMLLETTLALVKKSRKQERRRRVVGKQELISWTRKRPIRVID